MKKQDLIFLSFAFVMAVAFFISCERSSNDYEDGPITTQVMVHTSNLPMFADISRFNLGQTKTKSDDMGTTVCLDSLLDKSQTESFTIKGHRLTQTPFLSNSEGHYPYAIISDSLIWKPAKTHFLRLSCFL